METAYHPCEAEAMAPLRFISLANSLAFIAYDAAIGPPPVWLLHILLLIMNGRRLARAFRWRRARLRRGNTRPLNRSPHPRGRGASAGFGSTAHSRS